MTEDTMSRLTKAELVAMLEAKEAALVVALANAKPAPRPKHSYTISDVRLAVIEQPGVTVKSLRKLADAAGRGDLADVTLATIRTDTLATIRTAIKAGRWVSREGDPDLSKPGEPVGEPVMADAA